MCGLEGPAIFMRPPKPHDSNIFNILPVCRHPQSRIKIMTQ
jgi:hypothetical protein